VLVPIKRQSVGEQVYNQLKENLINGTWKVGEKIPSENELAAAFGTSRVTVRQALSKLTTLGLIETRLGEGSYVCELKPGIFMKDMIPFIYLSKDSTKEVLEFRLIIEVETAVLASERMSEDDLCELEENYREMAACREREDLESYVKEDLKFHMKIAEVTKNSLIIQLNMIIKDVLQQTIKNLTAQVGYDNGIKYHRMIIDAFREKDKEKVRKAVKSHLLEVREIYE